MHKLFTYIFNQFTFVIKNSIETFSKMVYKIFMNQFDVDPENATYILVVFIDGLSDQNQEKDNNNFNTFVKHIHKCIFFLLAIVALLRISMLY